MNDLTQRYDISKRDLTRGRNLKIAAWSAPFVLGGVPAAFTFILLFLFGTTPPVAATIFFLGMMISMVGFVAGLGLSGFFAMRYGRWTNEMRERIAAHGIRADEIEWFKKELSPGEKRALKDITSSDAMLADAYRDTLASRLTATRILKSSRRELTLMKRRQNKLKSLRTANAQQFLEQISGDITRISDIEDEAKLMLAEAESRLQMIEAAATRGSSIADSELALKRLSARAKELPIALESANLTDEIRQELEKEGIE
jgi:signal transduction histidine kinase